MVLLVICLNVNSFPRFLRDQNGNVLELLVFFSIMVFYLIKSLVNCGKDGYRSHEQMSVEMINHIVDEHHIDIDVDTVRRVNVSL